MTRSTAWPMYRLRTVAIVTTLIVGLAACGGNGSSAPASSGAESVTAEIGPLGGTLTGPNGVQVVVPPGALEQPTTIGIALSSAGAPTPPEDVEPGPIYEFTPHDVVFNAPVTIRMPVPANAVGTEVYMASPGGDWQVNDATVTGNVAEWQRNSFSWGMIVGACTVSPSSADPYPCSYPRGAASASATPAAAITRNTYGGWGEYSGSAGSWSVNQAGTVRLTLNYVAVPDCGVSPEPAARVKLFRWNPATPIGTPGRVQTLLDEPATLTPTTLYAIPGMADTAYVRNVGSTSFDVLFSQSDYVGTHAFFFSFSCNRPGRSAHSGGDLLTFIVASPLAPIATHTIGGSVTGLTGAGLVLRNNGGNDLAVAADGPFTFTTAIADGASYSVSVQTQPAGQTCSVTNGSGTATGDVTNVAVTCAAGSTKAWQGAALLENLNAGDAFESQVAFDANGNALAVWSQPATSGGKFNIWASRYQPGTGWGTAVQIQITDTTLDYRTPQIAFDASGNAIVVFAGFHPDGSETWAARYTAAGATWGTATQLTANGVNPQIAMDTSGNAMAVWQSWNGGANDIEARRYAASTGTWEPVQLIESSAGSADAPQIAFDAGGNAMAVWSQWDGTTYSIYSNRYSTGNWGTAVLVEAGAGEAASPQIASDAAGNMMAVWQQHDGTTTSIYSNRYSAGNWGTAVLVESSANYSEQSSIAMNGNGNAIVVWSEVDPNDVASIWARHYAAGVGGAAVRVDDLSGYTSGGSPQIAIDAGGNAMAVWMQAYNIWANRYVAGTGWGVATLIDSTSAGGASSSPQVAVDGNGNALAVWSRSGVSGPDIWGNVFR